MSIASSVAVKDNAPGWAKALFEGLESLLTTVDDDNMNIDDDDSVKDNEAVMLLPLEVFPIIFSFCPTSSFLKMRTVCKLFRNEFGKEECYHRYTNRLAMSKGSSSKKTSSQQRWGHCKACTIEKALAVAKSMFFESEEDDDEGTVLVADGYDEDEAREILWNEGVVYRQDGDGDGLPGKLWRVEARFKEVAVSEAIREMFRTLEDNNAQSQREEMMFRLLTANETVRISECEVSIRKRPGGMTRLRAFQLFSFEGINTALGTISNFGHNYHIFGGRLIFEHHEH
jgi:hypothetical protein